MDKTYDQKKVEEKWYKFWEESGFFKPEINPKGKPYTILLPPPNANGSLHFGHAMFTIEDILIRFHRMKGLAALWFPGEDHAGTETQFVFEKHLSKMGKSRFDYDKKTLYKMIWDFVQENRGNIRIQMKKMGFSLDWDRLKYTLDKDIVKIVYRTFKKMYDDGLIYRDYRLVNFCTKDGTSFSDLEVKPVEQKDPLYYLKYGPFVLATVRPETKFGDTAVAVNPNDQRYQKWIGKEIEVEGLLGKFKLKVIADDAIDPNFGTGVAKVTPGIDFKDFEIGKRHNLPIKIIVGFDGRLTEIAGHYAGMKVKEARQKIVNDMKEKGLIEKIDENYIHTIYTCYKCGTTLEPLPKSQWFIKTAPLAKKAIDVVRKGEIKIFPKNLEKIYFNWLENIKDWNISRQIVWGIQIPAWKCVRCAQVQSSILRQSSGQEFKVQSSNNEAMEQSNNESWIVTDGEKPEKCPKCGSTKLEQDPDTFDTWFSSGQWPFAALRTSRLGDFDKFYPTNIMETGRDILFFWVARMIMLSLYETEKIPFKDIVLHGTVLDPLGKKMSKSKGNVVNPIEIVDQYGADAVRFALVYGTAFGHDQALSHPKLQAMRNFTNKLWNIGRFIIDFPSEDAQHLDESFIVDKLTNEEDKEILEKLGKTIEKVTKALDSYRFHDAAEALYEFIWHEFADKYIEKSKKRRGEAQVVLEYVFLQSLKLLHPFMPFITEELYQKLPHNKTSIMIEEWPEQKMQSAKIKSQNQNKS